MGAKIVTTHVYSPIPVRSFDWQAHYDDDEPNDEGQMATGHGATEQEAIDDLTENHPRDEETAPVRTPGQIHYDNADRMRTALQLIASMRVAEGEKWLAMAVATAKAALPDDDDPMCEVLR